MHYAVHFTNTQRLHLSGLPPLYCLTMLNVFV